MSILFLLPLLASAAEASIPESDPETQRNYKITVQGEGGLTLKDEQLTGSSFVDLRIERRSVFADSAVTSGFHARAFFSTADVTNGNTPSMASILRIIEAYVEFLPDGADGIHVVRGSVGNTWVAFGYGADERASFASFPLASSLSTKGVSFAPNATLSYENREAGFTIDGSLFSPQENDSYLELENQGYSIRIRKGIAITTHLNVEAMASYANLYFPTRDERDQRFAGGAKVRLDTGREIKLEGLAEIFGQRAYSPAGASEAAGWLAMVKVTRGRASAGVRYSRTRTGGEMKSEVAVSGRYIVTRSNSPVKAEVSLDLGRISGAPGRPKNQVTVGVALSRGKKRK